MKTNIKTTILNNRFKNTLKKNEVDIVKQNTKKQIARLQEREDRHLLLELELAEIFKLGISKTQKIIDEHNKKFLSVAGVMNDLETFI
ncbi:MAG: hypothetical protein LBQ24_01915 [Candidatus Peribacteria bacterium]|jgi:hypothetical protein|nr:hypothetical protein [Candidatus Peribacteria bacterium]